MGGSRHLDLVPDVPGQIREVWPSPFAAGYDRVLMLRGAPLCVLASGDPMWHGLGAALARRIAVDEMRIFPAPSSVSLAAARLGWALHEVITLPLHGRPVETLHPVVHDGARLLLLADNRETVARVATLLADRGFGASALAVLEHLGGPRERRLDGSATDWPHPPGADLAVIAVTCVADRDGGGGLSRLAGLPDAAFDHDGQITKRDQRAATLARLAPRPGELLWDVGAGCGSIAIEWMRSHPACRAIAIEGRADRRHHIARNRAALGVPGLVIIGGEAPAALEGLEAPDAVFIGGGIGVDGMIETCWTALTPGGRLVANAVTLEGEAALLAARARFGGALTRLSVTHAGALGGYHGWRPAMPVTLYSVTKRSPDETGAPAP